MLHLHLVEEELLQVEVLHVELQEVHPEALHPVEVPPLGEPGLPHLRPPGMVDMENHRVTDQLDTVPSMRLLMMMDTLAVHHMRLVMRKADIQQEVLSQHTTTMEAVDLLQAMTLTHLEVATETAMVMATVQRLLPPVPEELLDRLPEITHTLDLQLDTELVTYLVNCSAPQTDLDLCTMCSTHSWQ